MAVSSSLALVFLCIGLDHQIFSSETAFYIAVHGINHSDLQKPYCLIPLDSQFLSGVLAYLLDICFFQWI